MQMIRMVTTAEHQYAGRRLRAGDEYDCETIHVALMKQLGWARPKEAPKAPRKHSAYLRRDMTAEE